jgi:hypothetical protein
MATMALVVDAVQTNGNVVLMADVVPKMATWYWWRIVCARGSLK